MKTEQKKLGAARRILTAAGVVVSALVLPILLMNLYFIIASYVDPDHVPSLFGVTPMVVVTDSMAPTIKGGDMIIDLKTDPKDVKVGDIISFFDPTTAKKDVVITHRVVRIDTSEETIHFYTQGDANNTEDEVPVPESYLVGVYKRTIPFAGQAVLFMRTPAGIILTVILPLIAVIAYDLVRGRNEERKAKRQAVPAEANQSLPAK